MLNSPRFRTGKIDKNVQFMRKSALYLLLLPVFVFIFTPHAYSDDITEVSIAWEDGLKPPFLMLDANNNPTGIAVDMLYEIFHRNKITQVHNIIPWARCLSEIKQQKVDLVPNSSYTKDREEFAYYTKPIYKTHRVLFYNTSEYQSPPKISSLEDLKSFRIGGVLHFNYDQYGDKIAIDTGASNREALINKLHVGRIDIAIEQKEVILRLAREGKTNLEGIGDVPDPVMPAQSFYVLCVKNKKGKQLQEIINLGIDQLQKDGTMEKIMKKYL
jgi:polar amino acid transport system substrate-binding protein